MKVYLVWGATGDYYQPEELYAVATSLEEAERLKTECVNEKVERSDGTHYQEFEGAYIKEAIANKRY